MYKHIFNQESPEMIEFEKKKNFVKGKKNTFNN